MSSPDQSPIQYTTVCRLCRKEIVKARPFLKIVGGAPDPRMEKYGMILFSHMASEHREQMGAILMLAAFDIQDPLLQEDFNALRWAIHTHSMKNWVEDASLQDKLASIGLDAETIAKVLPFCKDLRNFITEQGPYTPPAIAGAAAADRQPASNLIV